MTIIASTIGQNLVSERLHLFGRESYRCGHQ